MNLTTEALKQAAIGLAITVVLTLGAALVGVGPTTNLHDWARNLLIAEAGAVGAFVVNTARELLPASDQVEGTSGKDTEPPAEK